MAIVRPNRLTIIIWRIFLNGHKIRVNFWNVSLHQFNNKIYLFEGKATGIVTTTRLTHATPAAAYAKSAHRNWEHDGVTPNGCVDIAKQMIYSDIGRNIQVPALKIAKS